MTTVRRDFLKGSLVGALAAGGAGLQVTGAFADTAKAADSRTGQGLMAPPKIAAAPGTEEFWSEVRSAFPLSENYIHMNTGTTGSQPSFVQNNLALYNAYKSSDPLDWRQNLAADFPDLFQVEEDGSTAVDARQAAIARMYGANPDEIVLSYNTTDGCNMIFAGTAWEPGDRIITTNMEHPALKGPMQWAADYHGVEVIHVGIPTNFTDEYTVADVVAMFEEHLAKPLGDGNKQYLAISEIPYKNGLRLPIKELVAATKTHGGYTIIDSAHGWGMLPINCHDYGADFIAGAGHKWLCGGPGTGILYVRNSGENLPPFATGNFYRYKAEYDHNRDWSPAYVMQARGEYNRPALYAMSDSAAFFEQIGTQAIYDRGVDLGNYLKDKVADRWGKQALFVQKNNDPTFATFLTAFNPLQSKDDGSKYDAMEEALNGVRDELSAMSDPKIYIRTINWRDAESSADSTDSDRIGFRVSTHAVYNNEAEIDLMFDQLSQMVDKLDMPQLSS